MLKNVIIPEKIGNYYLFSKRILGFDIGKTHVSAVQLLLTGNSIIVEKLFEEHIDANTQTPYQEKISSAISKIVGQAHKKCLIYSALSSSVIVFKNIRLPFADREKIAMVIGYEIEPLLPFPLADSVVDFIITRYDAQEKTSEILVAAAQKIYVEQQVEYFKQAGVGLNKLSIDMFDLYGLYQKIPQYADKKGSTALIDLGFSVTRIAYIHNGQLRMIRTLPKGISRLVKMTSDQLAISVHDAREKIMRFGLGPSDDELYSSSIQTTMQTFLHEVQFTLSSFTAKDAAPIGHILICGGGTDIKGIDSFIAHYMDAQCERFSHASLFTKNIVRTKTSSIPTSSYTQCIASSLAWPTTQEINLLQKEFAPSDRKTFVQQCIVAFILCIGLFGVLTIHYIWQYQALSTEIQKSEEEIVAAIKKQFSNIPKDETTFDDIVEYAKKQVKKEEEMWFAFSNPARSSFLKYLLALHTLDKDGLGLDVSRLTIGDGTLNLTATVKDYDALKKLEKDLRQSTLFSYIEPQEKTDFTMRIKLVKNNEE